MQKIITALFISLACLCCKPDNTSTDTKPPGEIAFDKSSWDRKTGRDYPHRDSLLRFLMDSDTLRPMNEEEVIRMLGAPDRQHENYLYYLIEQDRIINFWPLHSKFLVIVLDSTRNKLLIHE